MHYDHDEDEPPGEPLVAPDRPLPADVPGHFTSIADVAEEHWHSPKGKYSTHCRDLSLALGGKRNADVAHGGHPFDLQIRRITAGAAVCPYHHHSAQWECFVFLSGRGRVRTPEGFRAVGPGDIVLHPPGAPHQTIADVDSELECLIVTDNPTEDVFFYPDSNKWGTRLGGKLFRISEVDYFDGEE
ncbi:MAG: cupin domain-containing protein [Cephaloticoccus sp.]